MPPRKAARKTVSGCSQEIVWSEPAKCIECFCMDECQADQAPRHGTRRLPAA